MSEMEQKKETREGMNLTTGETVGAIGAIVGSIVVGIGLKAGFDKLKSKWKAKKEADGDTEKKGVITNLKEKIESKKAEKETKKEQ